MIQIELMIKGTPAEFCVWVELLGFKLHQEKGRFVTCLSRKKEPDENPVRVKFRPTILATSGEWWGWITAYKIPDGTKLVIWAEPEKWITLVDTWNLIHNELERDGWLLRGAIEENGTKKPGRPRDPDNEWAREQFHVHHQEKTAIYVEWLERRKNRENWHKLDNPWDSFQKVLRTKPK